MALAPINIKQIKTLPRVLFHKVPNSDHIRMFNPHTSKLVGNMSAFATRFKGERFLHITTFETYPTRQGYGTEMMNYAKIYSKQAGCSGNIVLEANLTMNDTLNPPHIFYRKQQFEAEDKKFNAKLDTLIEQKKQLCPYTVQSVRMFYFGDKK